MKDLLSIVGYSKQAQSKYRKRKTEVASEKEKVVYHCRKMRRHHSKMSCRRIYSAVKEQVNVGRDIFEQIGFVHGFKIRRRRSAVKTTWSSKIPCFPNLIEGKTLNGPYQVIQSDFFYLSIEGKHYYGVCIIDVYTRELLALQVSSKITASELVRAFKEMVKKVPPGSLKNCIFHSDRGSQFFATEFRLLIEQEGMHQSMCKIAQENAYVERVQGSLKYEYFFELKLTKANIQQKAKDIKNLYNFERPHTQLGNLNPMKYKDLVNSMCIQERPQLQVYQWTHPLLTKIPLTNKEKRTKKETTTLINN